MNMKKCLIYIFCFFAVTLSVMAQTNTVQPPISQTNTVIISKSIQDIITLVDGKIKDDIIKEYIDTISNISRPTAEELVILKKHFVSDDLIILILDKSKTVNPVAIPKIVSDLSTSGTLDPESYNFWYYHYAYPRALSYSYMKLGPYTR